MRHCTVILISLVAFAPAGCEKSNEQPSAAKAPAPPPRPQDSHEHKAGDGHDHGDVDEHAKEASGHAGDSGEIIELGTTKIGDYSVRASRDKGDLKPGGDAPVDVWIDGGLGEGVTAVRFWTGTEDAKGSVKAKAAVENGKWHTHVELPDPLLEETALWIELETASGVSKGSVPL
jgi:hypothetical protein